MKLRKKVYKLFITILILICLLSTFVFATNEENNSEVNASSNEIQTDKAKEIKDFKGARYFSVLIDSSNLDNYINGGRSELEYLIRVLKNEWLNVELSVNGINLEVKMDFNFETYEDYIKKLEYLLRIRAFYNL